MASLVDVARLKFAGMPRECVRQVIVATGAHKEILDAFDAAGGDIGKMPPHELAYAARPFLYRADLSGAVLIGVYMPYTQARNANLSRANLSDSSIENSDFSHADLRRAILRFAYIARVDFCGADLRGADLTGVQRIGTATFTGCRYDDSTIWPDGFDPIKAGAIFTKGVKNE